MTIEEIDRLRAAGVRFGCVHADADYGLSAPFRQARSARNLRWTVGMPRHPKVYSADVELVFPARRCGPSRMHPVPDQLSVPAHKIQETCAMAQGQLASWNQRRPRGPLCGHTNTGCRWFSPTTDGQIAQHMPGEEAWLIGEHRFTGERKYYLSNLPADTSLRLLRLRSRPDASAPQGGTGPRSL